MSRIDWVVLSRVGSRIAVTVFIFYGIITLVESLDTWRFNFVANESGVPMALLMVAMSGVRWTIKTLPVTVLMGAILGFIDLKARHELTVIQSSGLSIWRIIRAPAIGLILVSAVVGLGAETASTMINRGLYPTPPGQVTLQTAPGEIWLEQESGDYHYVMFATGMERDPLVLTRVMLFQLGHGNERIEAPSAELEDGRWVMPTATLRRAESPSETIANYAIPTSSSRAEIELKLASPDDMTFFELFQMLGIGVSDSAIRAAAEMRMIKLLALPLVLTGSLFIAFAFTAGYRRTSNYGPAVLYGVVLGFIVFVITEMADRAGASGVLAPAFAAIGPAFVAIVIGVTVLLRKEDGRA
jgi:lipopolysaccharide export system permease protein